MRPAIARKLDEVCASYSAPGTRHTRCGLQTCQEDSECAFPTRCVALPSDLSDDGLIPGAAAPIERPHIMSLDELHWRDEGRAHGWEPPARRVWWRRLPVIRHVAALWLSWQVHTFAAGWARVGVGVGGPNPHDLWVVEGYINGYV